MRVLLAALTLFLAAASAMKATAGDAVPSGWRLVQSVGAVSTVTPGMTRVALNPNEVLPLGTRIRTGDTGQVVLVRGDEQIILDRSSEIILDGERGIITRIRQHVGSALFSIGKKKNPYFEVNTPYLAALVKGTKFTVRVSRGQSDVAVIEGAVEVSSRDGRAVTLLTGGKTGAVQQTRPGEIQIIRRGRVERRVTRDEGGWAGVTGGGSAGGGGGPDAGLPPQIGPAGTFSHKGISTDRYDATQRERSETAADGEATVVGDGTSTTKEVTVDVKAITRRHAHGPGGPTAGRQAERIAVEIDDTGTLEHSPFRLSTGATPPKLRLNGAFPFAEGGSWGMVPRESETALSFTPALELLNATSVKGAFASDGALGFLNFKDAPRPKIHAAPVARTAFQVLNNVFYALLGIALVLGGLTLVQNWRQAPRKTEADPDTPPSRQDRILGRH